MESQLLSMNDTGEVADWLSSLPQLEEYERDGLVFRLPGSLLHAIDVQPSSDKKGFWINFGICLSSENAGIEKGSGYDLQGRVVINSGETLGTFGETIDANSVYSAIVSGPNTLWDLCPDKEQFAGLIAISPPRRSFWPNEVAKEVKGLGAADCAFLLLEQAYDDPAKLWAIEALKYVPRVAKARKRKLMALLEA